MPCSVDPELPMPIRGFRAMAYETHSAVYENDFMNSRWLQYMPEGHVALHNVMFVPLNIKGKTVGIMGLANKPLDFTDEDAGIASVFGELAAIALENSRYLDLLNEKKRPWNGRCQKSEHCAACCPYAPTAKKCAMIKGCGRGLRHMCLVTRILVSVTGCVPTACENFIQNMQIRSSKS